MTEMMPDRDTPDQLPDVAYKILSPEDLVQAVVKIEFVPKSPDTPEIPPAIRNFNTLPMAKEFMKFAQPSKQELGSPKQAIARRARFLRVQPQILSLYNLNFSLETKANKNVQPARRAPVDLGPANRPEPISDTDLNIPGVTWLTDPLGGILGDGPGTADPDLVPDRPTEPNSGGRGHVNPPLSLETPPIPQVGRAAEISGEDPWSET